MPGRKLNSSNYRHGFNGQEKSPEIGEGNISFKSRIYDSRISRWFSTDPQEYWYPGNTPYGYVVNSPLIFVDKDGEWVQVAVWIGNVVVSGTIAALTRSEGEDVLIAFGKGAVAGAVGGFVASKIVGLAGTGYASMIGSNAIGGAIDNLTYQGGSIITGSEDVINWNEVGFSAAFGGALGGISKRIGNFFVDLDLFNSSAKWGDEIAESAGGKGGWNKVLNGKLEPNKRYNVDGHIYMTDSEGRVVYVEAALELKKKARNGYQQGKSVKIKDGIEGDQGGHLIASTFNGAGEQINYLPQTHRLNNSAWKKMENTWRRALKAGQEVHVQIDPLYKGSSKRPYAFKVDYSIDGKEYSKTFKN